jgi:hypothetical protein
MIFPNDAVLQLRGALEDRVTNGELSEAEAYREALAADPLDPRALRLLALLAEDQGDFAAADQLAWRWLRADPLSHEAFRLIGRLLGRDPAQAARAAAYSALGKEKLHFDPEAEEEEGGAAPPVPADEPPAVTAELNPHRLLHAMWIASTGELAPELIDQVLACGDEIRPLLLGILNLYGEDLLDDVDDALVVRAIALLGEIGNPVAIPSLTPFLPLEDETFSNVSSWAFQRISFRSPDMTLREIDLLIPAAGPFDLSALAQQLCMMPATAGRTDALVAIAERAASFSGTERAAVVVSVVTSAYFMEGLQSLLAARFMRDHGNGLPAEARAELKKIRTQLKDEEPYVAEEQEITVYNICCPGFEPAEEDAPYVRSEPKVGRNDPCWCGSGKKYKKCHLAADESR